MSFLSDNSANPPFSWKNFWRHYFYFFYFSGLYQFIIFISGTADFSGFFQAVFMSFLWLIPILLFPHSSKIIAGIIGLILWMSSLVSMGYLAIYHQDFSQSVLFIIFESNWAESGEYLESYFNGWMIPALVIYTLIPFLIWKSLKPVYASIKRRTVLVIAISLIVCWPALDYLVIRQTAPQSALKNQVNSMEPAAPWQLVMGYLKYRISLHKFEQNLLARNTITPLENFSDKNSDTPNTLVLVIGESTNGQRMSLYGYHRNTSPRLSALKNELLIFNHVFAPRPYTIETLEQVLSFADQQNPDLYLKQPSLIDMMKQAGYQTWWISNQQTQTQRNTMLTTFSSQTDEQIYLNNNRSQNSAQYDEVVFKPFEKLLNNSESKKFIIIHLLGTHRAYHYRYPESYQFFNNRMGQPYWIRKKRHSREYNDYDNAVLYNDFVVASLIQKLKKSKDNGFLVYFSDHGEEVYDYPHRLFAGRNEASPTYAMYTVPFFIWRSDSWKKSNTLTATEEMSQRPYSLSDFIYTWADLAGIHFKGFDSSRSIVNRNFSPHPVLIGDPKSPGELRDLLKQPLSIPVNR